MTSFFSQRTVSRFSAFGAFGFLLVASADAASADITPVDKRRTTVESAAKLAKLGAPVPLPDNLALPFNPPGFELTDAQLRALNEGSSARATVSEKVVSDRDILEEIATKVPPTGTIFINNEALLMFGKKPVKIGAHFTVTLNGQDYDLELVNIDRTTFTLRLNREEITRPIKPAAKSQ